MTAARRSPGFLGGLGGECLAEFLGTFVLIAFGTASVAVALAGLPGSGRQSVPFGAANWLIIAFGWGFAVAFGVYISAGISGAHLNPAVTLAFALRRGFAWTKVPAYWLAQVVGAFAAAALVYAVYRPAINAYAAANGVASRATDVNTFSIFATFPAKYFGGSNWGPLLDQVVGTAILVALIAALVDRRNQAPGGNLAPLLIGFVVVAIGLSFGTNAGYAINPARDFGPRVWTWIEGWGPLAFPGTGSWFADYWWVPVVGPLIGGPLGIFVYDALISSTLTARARAEGTDEPTPEPGRTESGEPADR